MMSASGSHCKATRRLLDAAACLGFSVIFNLAKYLW